MPTNSEGLTAFPYGPMPAARERRAPLAANGAVRMSEVISALSYSLDIVEGQPAGHAVRSCIVGMHLGHAVGLDEERSGEICNACVLLVKRYMKLPAGSSRHWNHVVDARSGPGIKSIVRAKKQMKLKGGHDDENNLCETPEKIKKKHVYHRKNKRTPLADKVIRNRNPSIDISPFLDMTVWKR